MDKWRLQGQLISTGAPVEIVLDRANIVSVSPADLLHPKPNYLVGFAKLDPEEYDERGKASFITAGRTLDVSYDEATEGGVDVATGDLYPYFYGGGNGGYDILLANIEIIEFVPA